MSTIPRIPTSLTTAPFRGSTAVADGLLSRTMLRGTSWQRLLPDVYAYRGMVLDHRAWCTAVGLVSPPRVAIGGPSAAHLWGADLLAPEPPVSVVAARDGWMNRYPRVSVHHTVFGVGDVTLLHGLRVTTPARTAFDLGRRLHRPDALILMDGMIRRGVLTIGDVAELARRRDQWPGVPRLREIAGLADGRAESPMETLMRLLFHDGGIRAPQPQYEVRDRRGRLLGRVDLGWPAEQVAAEYEGDHHRERDQFRRDITRMNALQDAGWTVLRFTANDIVRRPQETVSRVAAELARHR
ncbi:DUF559 domain-containing protein [Actinoplanes sp. NPDC051851]|uniref:DUF559 domain-containing protein n=1 Tax=Actinoplanes sp. NPDC051851 TaxID=3154753 RepID=UPI0034494971